MYKKRKSGIGITILLLLLTITFLTTTGFLYTENTQKKSELENVKETTVTLTTSKEDLEKQVQELRLKNEETLKKVEELREKVKILEEKHPEINAAKMEENQKYAYLTFDDGPSENTVKILDFLKVNNIKATFFVLGKQGYGEVYRRIAEEGHTLAVHSNTHNYGEIYKTVDSFMKDIEDLSNLIEKETGVKPDVLRFPGGSNNTVSYKHGGKDLMSKIIPVVEKAGYAYFDWNVDSMDAAKGLQDKNVIVNSVLNGAKYTDNAVILMHDAAAKKTTVQALPEIIEGLKKQGFMFKPLTTKSSPVKFK